MKDILIINGPNLNLLGEREPGIYGHDTYDSVCAEIKAFAKDLGFDSCECFQSNHEGAIIDKIHAARLDKCGIVINAGAYTHYSYAIRDAIEAVKIPVVEVHISNIEKREEFPAELFSEHFTFHVADSIVSERHCIVYIPFAAPISAVMETYDIPLTPELTEGEREYIERLIRKELGLEEDE